MVGLPDSIEQLNDLLLHIDIQAVEWLPGVSNSKNLFGYTKAVKLQKIIKRGTDFSVKTIYRKTVQLSSYDGHGES